MIRNSCIGYSLKDENKPLSEQNKVIAGSFKLFAECPQCKQEKELNPSMFTDNAQDNYGCSMCGWVYKCTCGKIINIWEGAFDNIIDSFYEAGLVEESKEYECNEILNDYDEKFVPDLQNMYGKE